MTNKFFFYYRDLWNGAAPNQKCMSKTKEGYMFWTHAAIGVTVNSALLIVPITVIYKKMMFSRTAIKVIPVLSVDRTGIPFRTLN